MKVLFERKIGNHTNQNHSMILLALKNNNNRDLVSAIQAYIASGLGVILN